MIAGIGSDIVELDRIRRLLAGERGRRFSERVLTHAEREIGERRESGFGEFVAGRFAAKEAVSKALGCGIGGQVGFRDIEIIPDERGRPVCRLSPDARRRLGLSGAAHIHVSISHGRDAAIAFAVLEVT